MSEAIRFDKINKFFPGAHVLKDISFYVESGEVHALLGENGAGKSTLLNILHGIYTEYDGNIELFGEKVVFKNPHEAIIKGRISKVHQETNIVADLTVGENVTLGCEPSKMGFVDRKELNCKVNAILIHLGCHFRSEDKAYNLSAGEMQMVAIAKALYYDARIISLDEPTASLSAKETENLFNVIRELKKKGITVLYVSHRLEEIFQICDKATVLRDGMLIRTFDVSKTTRKELIHSMVGRDVDTLAVRTKPCMVEEEVLLKVEGFTGKKFEGINFELHKGEILGFSGLIGSGRTELARAICGIDAKSEGNVFLRGKEVHIRNSSDALKLGIGLLPEDRKTQGILNLSTNIDNTAISSLKKHMSGIFVNNGKKLKNCEKYMKELDIHPSLPEILTSNMSGGNQQKVIIARWLSTDVDIIIFDEPTKGVDVGARVEIYRLIEEVAASGKGVIVISSDLTEVLGISDRILVMYEGRMTGEINRSDFREETVMEYAMGGTKE